MAASRSVTVPGERPAVTAVRKPPSAPGARPARSLPPAAAAASAGSEAGPDLLTIGRRLRHLRRAADRTLDEIAAEAALSPSALSLIENGKREAKLTVLAALSRALGTTVGELLTAPPPNRRAALEIELERAQRSGAFAALGLPAVRTGPRLPIEALESLVGLHRELGRLREEQAATPEQARRANAALRADMRQSGNYAADIEKEAADLVARTSYQDGPITRNLVEKMAGRLGFVLRHSGDLPESTRTVTDLANRVIYLPRPDAGQHDSRALALQALGHVLLGHRVPADYSEFLAQRVQINYFAAAVLLPEKGALNLLRRGRAAKDIAIEDLRDAYAVSYETAAHRFTNLATHHFDLPVHFMRISASGVIYKAYENDGVHFPADSSGAIEGQRVCRFWTARAVFDQPDWTVPYQQYTDTPSGTYWCTAMVDRTANGLFSVSVGLPYQHVKWMRGRDTTARSRSRCPAPDCCADPPAPLAARWQGKAWPSARVHSHLLAAMPPGVFPGVDQTEVFEFLDRQAEVGER